MVYRTSVQLNTCSVTYSRSEGMIIIIISVWEYPDPSHVRCSANSTVSVGYKWCKKNHLLQNEMHGDDLKIYGDPIDN